MRAPAAVLTGMLSRKAGRYQDRRLCSGGQVSSRRAVRAETLHRRGGIQVVACASDWAGASPAAPDRRLAHRRRWVPFCSRHHTAYG